MLPRLRVVIPLLVLLAPSPTLAHRLLVDYRVQQGGRVWVAGKFEGGGVPLEGTIRVLRSNGKVLCEGTLDEEGRYRFRVTEPDELLIEVLDTGHRAEVKVPADVLAKRLFQDAALLTAACLAGIEQPLAAVPLMAANQMPDAENAPPADLDRALSEGPPILKVLLGVGLLLGLAALVAIRRARAGPTSKASGAA